MMNWLRGATVLLLLIANRRYRLRWDKSAVAVCDALDDIEASHRRCDAADNGGRPLLRRVV